MMLGISVAAIISIILGAVCAYHAHDLTVRSYKDQTDGMIFVIKQLIAGAWLLVVCGLLALIWSGVIGYNTVWVDQKVFCNNGVEMCEPDKQKAEESKVENK